MMTDEQAKEIAEKLRMRASLTSVNGQNLFLLKLYDDIQAIKQAMAGLSFLGVGGGIKPVTKTDG
jgi:hypothetical protein